LTKLGSIKKIKLTKYYFKKIQKKKKTPICGIKLQYVPRTEKMGEKKKEVSVRRKRQII
jgi:hypothetical protein